MNKKDKYQKKLKKYFKKQKFKLTDIMFFCLVNEEMDHDSLYDIKQIKEQVKKFRKEFLQEPHQLQSDE